MVARREARLDAQRAMALDAIDAAAGRARARYITVAPGQEGTYLLKAAQAQHYLEAGAPADATAWPLIALEAAARAMTPADLATEVLGMRDAWIGKAAQIEATRLAAKRAVLQAQDAAGIAAVRDEALTALAAL